MDVPDTRMVVDDADDGLADIIGGIELEGRSARVVAYDPLDIKPNNRQYARELDRQHRDEQKLKHLDDDRKLREAGEAAR
jgi:hypothetical protein